MSAELIASQPVMPMPMTDSSVIRVMIVEDQREVREGLMMLIDGTHGFECTGGFRTMEDAIKDIAASSPDALPNVVLTDINLPGMSGTEGIKILRASHPQIPLLALTVYDDDDDDEVFNALCAGASGYLLKNTQPARLLESLKGSCERRRADVAGSGASRRASVSQVSTAADGFISTDGAGDGAVKTVG